MVSRNLQRLRLFFDLRWVADGRGYPRFVAHVPVSTSAQPNSAQPKAPQAKVPQVKYAQGPQAKAAKVSSPKPGIRIRIGRR
jgi:hypothetical protein